MDRASRKNGGRKTKERNSEDGSNGRKGMGRRKRWMHCIQEDVQELNLRSGLAKSHLMVSTFQMSVASLKGYRFSDIKSSSGPCNCFFMTKHQKYKFRSYTFANYLEDLLRLVNEAFYKGISMKSAS